jgi:hypothetical protein
MCFGTILCSILSGRTDFYNKSFNNYPCIIYFKIGTEFKNIWELFEIICFQSVEILDNAVL